jgi:hypothetical protein
MGGTDGCKRAGGRAGQAREAGAGRVRQTGGVWGVCSRQLQRGACLGNARAPGPTRSPRAADSERLQTAQLPMRAGCAGLLFDRDSDIRSVDQWQACDQWKSGLVP